MTSVPAISRKRPLAVRDFPPGCGPCAVKEAERKPVKTNKEFGGNGSSDNVVVRPVGKVKYLDSACLKAGYDQEPKVTTTIGMKRKNFDHVDSNTRKMTSNDNDKVEKCELKRSEPKELGRNKSYLGSRSMAKVKLWDPIRDAEKPVVTTGKESRKDEVRRKMNKEVIDLFEQVYESLLQKNRLKPNCVKIPHHWNLIHEAVKIAKQKMKWVDPGKIVGHVCGVQIGDKFKYRAQLVIIGLHSQHQSGIDFVNIEGRNLAISIVDAQRYSNVSGSSDTLVYSGQGGCALYGGPSAPEDQKLVRGNLALKNSMERKTPVRVIRKVTGYGKDVFAYDGLYIVKKFTEEKSKEGKIVYKFHLNREPGQPDLHKMLKW